jgi:hypothetical protein
MSELKVNRRVVLDLAHLDLSGVERIHHVSCHVLHGSFGDENDVLWISTDNFSLRHLQCKIFIDDKTFVADYNFEKVEFNEVIRDDLFNPLTDGSAPFST